MKTLLKMCKDETIDDDPDSRKEVVISVLRGNNLYSAIHSFFSITIVLFRPRLESSNFTADLRLKYSHDCSLIVEKGMPYVFSEIGVI